jgi:anthranilate phosphoribosyltransferase
MITETIEKLLHRENLSAGECREVMDRIMSGHVAPAQIAAYLTALRQKGETAEEICGSARAMRDKARRIEHHQTALFDNCGTGGDGAGTFNISTTAAFVLAGCGLAIGKHGNRSVSSRSGSADLLRELGACIMLTPETMGRCINEIGIGFLFAPLLHPAMKEVAPVRRELGFRTIFNLLGPLTNPAFATHQLIGVCDISFTDKLAAAARELGIRRTCVVYNLNHVDELTTAGPNKVSMVYNGTSESFLLDPREYGFAECSLADLAGGEPAENAAITRSILQGERGPRRDTVVLNAAVSLVAAEKTDSIRDGIAQAATSIDSGAALDKLNAFIEFTNKHGHAE